jgi:hypothetical protein
MSRRKDIRRLLRAAEKAGATVSMGGNSHWQVRFNGLIVTMSTSPSDRNWHKQVRRQLRCAGLDI